MRLHASTYIEEQQHIDGHVLAFKMTDLLLLTIFGENEVFRLQTRDRSIVPIDNLCIDANQRHVTTKRNVFFGRCEGNTEKYERGQNTNETGHCDSPFPSGGSVMVRTTGTVRFRQFIHRI